MKELAASTISLALLTFALAAQAQSHGDTHGDSQAAGHGTDTHAAASVTHTAAPVQNSTQDSHAAAPTAPAGHGGGHGGPVSDDIIAAQRAALYHSSIGVGFGPQSPRDIDRAFGANARVFATAPHHTRMNLCNIHLHEGAEHRGGDFTLYIGNGDGEGYGTGFAYVGRLTPEELTPYHRPVGATEHGSIEPGDTIEVHFVYTTADVRPGATLGACLDDETGNPQLRVEAQIMVVVNDDSAARFTTLAALSSIDGYAQAPNLPMTMGMPVVYQGSTTGPGYNEIGSPYQVTWSVRPQVMRVSIASLDAWFAGNVFNEDHAHGVRNLVIEPELLSPILR
ncbi:hypothetical protein JI664_21985 [Rhodobacter sp. NTK016B]|uniref:delta-class carbonic anhydrase n=1 Tax=Rhodobacter sp. NTK016B TaxID=2759676 RepID=UPI001A8C7A26|nr:delta-class carbonic anhydrase [Rhodobacter sp. NTK016B]MBN8294657.1 hypothetical protein [Rhodobacter sp. NTK016B]